MGSRLDGGGGFRGVPSSGEGGVNRTKLDGGWKIKYDIVVINKLTNSSAADGRIHSFFPLRC